jgi:metallo-beta-lactamase class B
VPAVEPVESHLDRAVSAAQSDYQALFASTCGLLHPELANKPALPATVAEDRSTWHREPVQIFDNLYFIGQAEFSAWALTSSEGIIVLDAIFDYSVEDEIIGGLRTLDLDPKRVRYVVISHAHGDHVGGAKKLQDLGAKIVMAAPDWDLLERADVKFAKPKRDVVAVEGQELQVGDARVTLHVTPGHTLGTLSSLFQVKQGSEKHTVAYWGGTAFNWVRNPEQYVTAERPAKFWFESYAESAHRFQEIANKAGADVILSNHAQYDGSVDKIAALKANPPQHPYVVGKAAVQRFFSVAEECALTGVQESSDVASKAAASR